MIRFSILAPALGAALLLSAPAGAVVIDGAVTGGFSFDNGGVFRKIAPGPGFDSNPPNTVGRNNHEDLDLYAFDEDQNILLTADLVVDATNPALGPGVVTPTSILAGTVLASHYVFYDPAGGTTRDQRGWVAFDAVIVGVAYSTETMAASDFLANSGITYLSPELRGLEAGDGGALAGGGYRITLDWAASNPGDFMRIFTLESPGAAVPVPAAAPLLLAALGGLAALRRRA